MSGEHGYERGSKRPRVIGERQLQRPICKEFTEATENVTSNWNDAWLTHPVHGDHPGASFAVDRSSSPNSTDVQPCGEPTDTTAVLPDEPSDQSLNESFVVSVPTRRDDLYSDCGSPESSDDEKEDDDSNLRQCLRLWYTKSKVNISQLGNLLKHLRPFHPDLPVDPRTIVRTPRQTSETKSLDYGTYIHLGLKHGIELRAQFGVLGNLTTLRIDIGIDGIKMSESSNLQAWPILARCPDLLDNKPFCVGIYCGYGKPDPVEKYLEDYVSEVEVLLENGVTVNGKHFDVRICKYILDAPARAFVKCIKHHTGYSACERCVQLGEYVDHRMLYDPWVSFLRTEETFRLQTDPDHHHGESPLLKLPTDFISMFVLDPMHLLHHGVVKRFCNFLIKECKTTAKLRARDILEISERIRSLSHFIPDEFKRKNPNFQFDLQLKGVELRLFVLYISIVVLKGIVDDAIYHLFLLLHVASRIVSSPVYARIPEMMDYAERQLEVFVKHCADKTVFGKIFVVYNVHSILHMCSDVRRFGDINQFSAYPFENHLGIIKRMMRSGVKVTQQLARRMAEQDAAYQGPSRIPSQSFVTIGWNYVTGCYKSLSNGDFTLAPEPSRESFFKTDECIGKVKKIQKTAEEDIIVADICESLGNFYSYPDDSRNYGVYSFKKWTAQNVNVRIKDIKGKCMVFPYDDQYVAIHLLHTAKM